MSVDDVIRDLGAPDRRSEAADSLVALGRAAVGPVLRQLMDESSSVDWARSARVLQRLGVVGFDLLAEGLMAASTQESQRRAGWVFSRYGVDALDRYIVALAHPHPRVRAHAALGIQFCGETGVLAAADLVPLLGDADEAVTHQAQSALTMLGPAVVPMLLQVRESGPGKQRAGALSVLAAVGGESVLSAKDLAVLERLVRIKLLDDRPEPLWTCWNHWIAVPNGDQAGIMEVLGLSRPRPVTFALAHDAVDSDGHEGPGADTGCWARVFVTPELDGWTLVVGGWCDPCGEERCDDVLRLCTELSVRYGMAQAYYYGAQGDGSAWLIVENGTVVRRYCESGEGTDRSLTIGEPLPYERARRAELGLSPDWDPAAESEEDEDEWSGAAYIMAPEIAESLGISPLAIGADTPTRGGTGVLALTPYGVEHGVPSGSYRI